MPRFATFDGIELAYDDEGEGPPVLLLHGFAPDTRINWRRPGVIDALVGAGRGVLAYDARGHGRSDKPHRPEDYGGDAMARDAQTLLDRLGLREVDVVGYSMGSLTTLRLLVREPRVRSAVLGGVGDGGERLRRERPVIADGVEADDHSTISNPTARAFRSFADATRADRGALAAIQRGAGLGDPSTRLSEIRAPVLVIAGDGDELVGSPQGLADRIPGARALTVSGDHLSAVTDPAFADAVVGFLAEQDARPSAVR